MLKTTFMEGIVMANETVASPPPCTDVTGIFEQAFRAVGDSVKAAIKAQEDAVKFWGEAITKGAPGQAVPTDWFPAVQKNTQEYMRLMETSYRRNADLLKKVIQNGDGGAPANSEGMEKRAREWWEASMEVARSNAEDLMSTNMRVAQSWTDAFKKAAQQKEPSGK
jgi:hypothetical protein